jgi:hypothetical protein
MDARHGVMFVLSILLFSLIPPSQVSMLDNSVQYNAPPVAIADVKSYPTYSGSAVITTSNQDYFAYAYREGDNAQYLTIGYFSLTNSSSMEFTTDYCTQNGAFIEIDNSNVITVLAHSDWFDCNGNWASFVTHDIESNFTSTIPIENLSGAVNGLGPGYIREVVDNNDDIVAAAYANQLIKFTLSNQSIWIETLQTSCFFAWMADNGTVSCTNNSPTPPWKSSDHVIYWENSYLISKNFTTGQTVAMQNQSYLHQFGVDVQNNSSGAINCFSSTCIFTANTGAYTLNGQNFPPMSADVWIDTSSLIVTDTRKNDIGELVYTNEEVSQNPTRIYYLDSGKSINGDYVSEGFILTSNADDYDMDSIPDSLDADDDDDGIQDVIDNCIKSSNYSFISVFSNDYDQDGCEDSSEDNDKDNDGVLDISDSCPLGNIGWQSTNITDFDQDGCYDFIEDRDDDNDGWLDFEDRCPIMFGNSTLLPMLGCVDTDADGYADLIDDCVTAFGSSDKDLLGCPDSDGDKYSDINDKFPLDPSIWIDSDSDGFEDSVDAFPFNQAQSKDSDGDGYGDNMFGGSGSDKFPMNPTQWSDIDGDGYGDNQNGTQPDAFIADPTQWTDADGDGFGDNPSGRQADLFSTDSTQWEDLDGDGLGDNQSGNNPDPYLFDFDNDGYNDSTDPLPKLASPGDMDYDGIPDGADQFPSNGREWADADGDGEGDNADTDDDNDGWSDADETRAGTDPLSSSSQPVNTFEIVIPGTTIGLGAWDLIGIFGGIPLFAWIGFGFVTRNSRTGNFEALLREAKSRKELEEIATRWEYALMLRLLGPHQGIRLERLRSELDDWFENQSQPLASTDGEDSMHQTHLVENEMDEQDSMKTVPSLQYENQHHPSAEQHADSVDKNGYEWFTTDEGANYYRTVGSNSEWIEFEN